jgi:D-3-phosphoglycerate dehydrogenase
MRILFADSNHPVLHELLMEAGYTCDLYWDKSADELMAILPDYDALVIRSRFRITRELIDACPSLKCIGRVGAGMENIDVAYAATRSIKCLCVPEGNRDAVGEHALGMLLMLLNHLKRADAEVRQGIWRRAENRGSEIREKTIGIIGYGNMGSAFAEKLSGLGCRIMAYDKYKSGYGSDRVVECSLETLQAESDVISLHVPLTAETRYMVNVDFIRRCEKEFFLVNTARGPCVNTADLVAALKTGRVRGACLDVLEYETVSFEKLGEQIPEPLQYLVNSENVVLSPHIAGWTHESNYRMSRLIAIKMIKALKDKNQA